MRMRLFSDWIAQQMQYVVDAEPGKQGRQHRSRSDLSHAALIPSLTWPRFSGITLLLRRTEPGAKAALALVSIQGKLLEAVGWRS